MAPAPVIINAVATHVATPVVDLAAFGIAPTPGPAPAAAPTATPDQVNQLIGEMARTHGDDAIKILGDWMQKASASGFVAPGARMFDLTDEQRGALVTYMTTWAASRPASTA